MAPSPAGRSHFAESSAEVLVSHRNGSGNQVAQVVCEVGVDTAYHYLVGEVAVGAVWHVAEYLVAHRVGAIALCEHERVDNVAQGLGHLLSVEVYPAISRNTLIDSLNSSEKNTGIKKGAKKISPNVTIRVNSI